MKFNLRNLFGDNTDSVVGALKEEVKYLNRELADSEKARINDERIIITERNEFSDEIFQLKRRMEVLATEHTSEIVLLKEELANGQAAYKRKLDAEYEDKKFKLNREYLEKENKLGEEIFTSRQQIKREKIDALNDIAVAKAQMKATFAIEKEEFYTARSDERESFEASVRRTVKNEMAEKDSEITRLNKLILSLTEGKAKNEGMLDGAATTLERMDEVVEIVKDLNTSLVGKIELPKVSATVDANIRTVGDTITNQAAGKGENKGGDKKN